jgi:tripartite-type tricarboxylate transporter receptor subunit TctC
VTAFISSDRELQMKVIRVVALMGCVLAPIAPERAIAQESASLYPSRPVTFVVPFAPGGSTGLIARVVGQKLEQRLGKPFVVDHRAGGGGVIGVTAVAHGTRDGYTIMWRRAQRSRSTSMCARPCRMIRARTSPRSR